MTILGYLAIYAVVSSLVTFFFGSMCREFGGAN